MWMEKPLNIYGFRGGQRVLQPAARAGRPTRSRGARVSSAQPATPTAGLQPVSVQRVLVASCREAKLSCRSSGVLSTLTDTSAPVTAQGLPDLPRSMASRRCPQGRRQRGPGRVDPLTAESKGGAEGPQRRRKPGRPKPGRSQTGTYSVQLTSPQFRSPHRTAACAGIWFSALTINLAILRCILISAGLRGCH